MSGQQLAADGGYRVATVLLYLTDVEEGGEARDARAPRPAIAHMRCGVRSAATELSRVVCAFPTLLHITSDCVS